MMRSGRHLCRKHKCATTFLKRPLMFKDKMYEIFKRGYATGNKSWAPSKGVNMVDTKKQQEDVDVEPSLEGTGDFDEHEHYNLDDMEDTYRSGNESRPPPKNNSSLKRKSSDCGH